MTSGNNPRKADENSYSDSCDVFGCSLAATQRVRVRISPTTVTYANLCDECAPELVVLDDEMDEYTELYLGSNVLDSNVDDLFEGMCRCGHTKPYHWLTSCVGRDESRNRCICRGFSPE